MSLTFASVCSGIEAPSCAWRPLGWRPLWFSEIEPFCCALLEQRHPGIPNLGDMTRIQNAESPDVLVGGTPCQSFSVAGLRGGMADPRGNLALVFLGLVDRLRPRWVVWENVPGVLSSNGGKDFGAFLGGLGECGYGFAYRVLDARNHGLPQSRRRVIVVAHDRARWQGPAAVLFDRQSLAWPGGEGGESASQNFAHALSRSDAPGCGDTYVLETRGLRVFTTLERERLMGFPEGYTRVGNYSERRRNMAIGNSIAVPVLRWIGERIEAVDKEFA